MRGAVRGSVNNGNLLFYKGWDSDVGEDTEKEFFAKWEELKQKLAAEGIVVKGIYGGVTKYPGVSQLLPKRGYGFNQSA